MGKRTRTDAGALATPTPALVHPQDPSASRAAEKHPRKDPASVDAARSKGKATGAQDLQGGKEDAGAGVARAEGDGDESSPEDKAARKAAKAERKAARKAAKEAAAGAPVEAAASSVDESPAKKSRKDKKGKGKERDVTSEAAGGFTSAASIPTTSTSTSTSTSASRSSSGGSSISPLDPSLAGLLRDDPAASRAGDIPVDPVLLQLRPIPAAAAFAAGPEAGAAKVKETGMGGEENDGEGKKEKKAKKDKKGKDKAVLDESEAAPAPAPAPAPTGEAAPAAAPEKEKKKRGRPPKAASAESSGDAPKAKRPKKSQAAPLAGSKEEQFYEDLVTKWMNAAQLREAVEAAGGPTYSQGRFTTAEDATIDTIVAAFRRERQYTDAEFRTFLVVKRAAADKALQRADNHDLWERIARALRTRPLLAVYNHVRARYPPPDAESAKGTAWTEDEDKELRRAIREMGNSWERVGTAVGRTPTACRDRWTKQLNEGREVKKGAWGTDEEEQLRALVGTWGMQWKIVSQKMGGTRTATQCRTKWNDYLKRRDAAATAGADDQFKWRPEDSSRLVHLVASLTPLPATVADLPWSTLAKQDAVLAPHGTKNLRDRFRPLAAYAAARARKAKGLAEDAEVPLADILPTLLASHPSPTERPLKRPRLSTLTPEEKRAQREAKRNGGAGFKSAAVVESSEEDEAESSGEE
ncbi:RNA polymerase I enhancer binding protein [Rhodotorula kratochvilovae]